MRAGAPGGGAGRGAPPEGRGARRKGAALELPLRASTGRWGGGAAGLRSGRGGYSRRRFVRTAGVAWDAQGNIYVADGSGNGIGNARVAKFQGRAFHQIVGTARQRPGPVNSLRGIALDAKGNVYVADGGNKRIQVFDADGNPKAQISGVGVPAAICITPGTHQYLYVSNSNDAETLDNGEIYKMELDGTLVGKFGRAGRLPKEFNMVNAIDCRSENELFVGELANWRVQKLTLHPTK